MASIATELTADSLVLSSGETARLTEARTADPRAPAGEVRFRGRSGLLAGDYGGGHRTDWLIC
jgi:hypothetical protein